MKNTKKSLRRITATLVAMAASASFAAAPISGAGITFSMPSFSASAADTDVLTYENYSYKVTENGIVITAYNGSEANPVIPSAIDETAVTAIGSSAFKECTNLTKLEIPSSITEIGNSAFYNCTGLTEIEIPSSVTTIGGSAFAGCISLEKLTLNEGLTTLGSNCFQNTIISSVNIPSTLTSVDVPSYNPHGPFYNCKSLKNVTFDDKTTMVVGHLFNGCVGLETVNIPDTVNTIGNSAFSYCYALTEVDIPYSVATIEAFAFEDCTSLKDITIHNPYCNIYNKDVTISGNATIKGYATSTAENYALTYEREFVSLGSFTLGDVNEDGMIDSSDASMVLAEYALMQTGGEPTFTEIQKISADVNKDYSVDSSDASKILAYYADSSTGKTPSWD